MAGWRLLREALGDSLAPGGGIWTGALDELLDAWTGVHGYEWGYDEAAERIDIVRSRSVVYQLHALAGEQSYEVSSSTEDQAGDDEGSNQTKQSIDTSASFDPWPEIETQLFCWRWCRPQRGCRCRRRARRCW